MKGAEAKAVTATDTAAVAAARAKHAADRDLVEACLDEQPGAWHRLVDRYAPVIAMVARRTLRARRFSPSSEDIEDICENAFFAICRNDYKVLRAYDDRYALTTYLGIVARTHAGRYVRKKRHRTCDVDGIEVAGREPDPATTAADRELQRAVRETMGSLSERDQRVLQLFYYSDLDYQEIARELGVSPNSVGAALSRARARLKVELEKRRAC